MRRTRRAPDRSCADRRRTGGGASGACSSGASPRCSRSASPSSCSPRSSLRPTRARRPAASSAASRSCSDCPARGSWRMPGGTPATAWCRSRPASRSPSTSAPTSRTYSTMLGAAVTRCVTHPSPRRHRAQSGSAVAAEPGGGAGGEAGLDCVRDLPRARGDRGRGAQPVSVAALTDSSPPNPAAPARAADPAAPVAASRRRARASRRPPRSMPS